MVDCGIGFAGPEQAGIDLIVPDLRFVEKVKQNLLGLIITHGHEDHIGAVADLWPLFQCKLYATPFAAGLLKMKRLSEPGAPEVPIEIVMQGQRISLGPFSVEFIPVAHSIPESCALAIRTPAGTVLHTGDWKIDAGPGIGKVTDVARLTAIGDEGVLALVCDSTNILRDGVSPSEADVANTLREIIVASPGRVVVSTFASNVARMRAVALAAMARNETWSLSVVRWSASRRWRANAAISTASPNFCRWMPIRICPAPASSCWRPAARASAAPLWRGFPKATIR